VADVQIGMGKTSRRAYSFDDIAIVPSRRTRDPEEISVAWQIDAYRFEAPIISSAMDSVVSPDFAIEIGRLGGLGVLDLEGLWTRYDDPQPILEEIATLPEVDVVRRMREIYSEPIKEELIGARIKQIRDGGVVTAAALSPQRTAQYHKAVLEAGVDLFVIRGTTVSAEHVSTRAEPLNLKKFIYDLDVPVIVGGSYTYQSALHTTRQVLGIGVPMATVVSDAAAARRDYMDESGGRYVHVIADGAMRTGGDIAKAIACGADAVMIGLPLARAAEAPGGGWHWGAEARHNDLARGKRFRAGTAGTLREVLYGPSTDSEGTTNLVGALRKALATCGYSDLKEFQRVEVVVTC
jgi:IMP dehydrogenase